MMTSHVFPLIALHLHRCISSRYTRCATRGTGGQCEAEPEDGARVETNPEDGRTDWSACLDWDDVKLVQDYKLTN